MASQKCKIILLQAVLKDFWSANLKLKKLNLSKLSLPHTEKMQEWGLLGVTFGYKWFVEKSTKSFQKKLNFEGLQTYERHESNLIMS